MFGVIQSRYEKNCEIFRGACLYPGHRGSGAGGRIGWGRVGSADWLAWGERSGGWHGHGQAMGWARDGRSGGKRMGKRMGKRWARARVSAGHGQAVRAWAEARKSGKTCEKPKIQETVQRYYPTLNEQFYLLTMPWVVGHHRGMGERTSISPLPNHPTPPMTNKQRRDLEAFAVELAKEGRKDAAREVLELLAR